MSDAWRNELATEKQKEKLRFFGCTWDEGIMAGQASDALEECANQFPDAEAAYQKSQPATKEQKDKLRFFGCTWNGDITVGDACEALLQCARDFPDREMAWQKQKKELPEAADENLMLPVGHWFPPEPKRTDPKYQAWINPAGQEYGFALDHMRWKETVKQIKAQIEAKKLIQERKAATDAPQPAVKREDFYPAKPQAADDKSGADEIRQSQAEPCQSVKEWDEWIALRSRNQKRRERQIKSGIPPFQEVTIQKAVKPQDVSPREYIIPARDVQDSAPHRPAIQKPATYNSATPIERFVERVDIVLERNYTCLSGHWLPVGPVCYPFTQDFSLTIGLCRQIADTIESKGYCVEPDARFGSGKYDKMHTLALFKPFYGDPIQPSTAYRGAANLLRLCILIASADGQIDLVELDVFRQAIENQIGLTLTDHKRLLILEQLLAQELCSASKTTAKITKSVPADKRLVIGKLLVEVAAANNVITNGERRALEEIFSAFEIPPDSLENLISQICPSQWPRPELFQGDVSKWDKWLWNHWRTGHPGVVIDDTTLAGKTWNFNDWKALNARWRALHERLAARQKQSSAESGASSQEAGTRVSSEQVPKKVSWLKEFLSSGRMLGAKGEQIQKPVAAPAPRDFALDMARVYEITNETKEVVAILSVLMEDEPEESIAMTASITLPAPEIPKVSSDGKAAPQPARFNGLDAAFHPILERLLKRDSWPLPDFNALASEFNFMPLNIRDTLNEWSDEALGDFILDGEDPVIIHRELMAKETTCYG
jgi:uncharacterized tellurite resistance protein B-like protein